MDLFGSILFYDDYLFSEDARARSFATHYLLFSRIQVCFISDDLAFEIGDCWDVFPPSPPPSPPGVMMSDLSEI